MPPRGGGGGGDKKGEGNCVRVVSTLTKIDDAPAAKKLLNEIKLHADPLLAARGWHVGRLVEICCCEKRSMPDNVGGWCRSDGSGRGAQTIAIRLRRPRSHDLLSLEHCIAVMMHEMAHIAHMNHSAKFYQLMDELKQQQRDYVAKGIVLDSSGFPMNSSQARVVDPTRHNAANSRETALKAAEKRAQRPTTTQKLGGGSSWAGLSPRDAALRAAERRAADGFGDENDDADHPAPSTAPKRPGDPMRWDGSARAMCPICGPVCSAQEDHAALDSDGDDDVQIVPPPTRKKPPQKKKRDAAPTKKPPKKPEEEAPQKKKPASQSKKRRSLIDLTEDDDDDAVAAASSWSCGKCTLVNEAPHCAACGEPRDGTSARAVIARPMLADTSHHRKEAAAFDPCKSYLGGRQL